MMICVNSFSGFKAGWELLWWDWLLLISTAFTLTAPRHFFVFLPQLSFCLSHSISPLTPPPSISPLCLMLQPFHQKENGKTANPAACYGIRVYQPIMPFSDLFSSQDLSLCACIPPPPTPHLSLITQQRQRMLYFQLQTLLQHYPTTANPLIVKVVSMLRGVCQKLHTERDACQCSSPTTSNSRLGSALSWEGFQQDTFFYLMGGCGA